MSNTANDFKVTTSNNIEQQQNNYVTPHQPVLSINGAATQQPQFINSYQMPLPPPFVHPSQIPNYYTNEHQNTSFENKMQAIKSLHSSPPPQELTNKTKQTKTGKTPKKKQKISNVSKKTQNSKSNGIINSDIGSDSSDNSHLVRLVEYFFIFQLYSFIHSSSSLLHKVQSMA